MFTTIIDNDGLGNCLYYAYGISLMHYLKSLPSGSGEVNEILSLLMLKDDERHKLMLMIESSDQVGFADDELSSMQAILHPSLRELSANLIVDNFKEKRNENSPLYAALHYAFTKLIRLAWICMERQDLVKIIDESGFVDEDIFGYQQAEIFRVPGICEAIKLKAEVLALEFVEGHADSRIPPELAAVEKVFSTAVIDFMLSDNEYYLQAYRARLSSPSVWATEESLLILHAHIRGDAVVKNEATDRWEERSLRKINLVIKSNDFDVKQPLPHLVIVNQSNAHWVSDIPFSIIIKLLFKRQPHHLLNPVMELLSRIESMIDFICSTEKLSNNVAREQDEVKEKILGDILNAVKLKTFKHPNHISYYESLKCVVHFLENYLNENGVTIFNTIDLREMMLGHMNCLTPLLALQVSFFTNNRFISYYADALIRTVAPLEADESDWLDNLFNLGSRSLRYISSTVAPYPECSKKHDVSTGSLAREQHGFKFANGMSTTSNSSLRIRCTHPVMDV